MRETHIGRSFQCVPVRALGFGVALAMTMVTFLAIPGAAASFVGGGWYVGFHSINTPDINSTLTTAGFPAVKQGVVVYGGGGSGPLSAGDGNWTFGGFGAGGQAEASDGVKRSRLALGYGGLRVGYSRPLTERVSLGAGLGVAFGGVTLTLVQRDPKSVGDGITNPGEATYNRFLLALVPDAGLSLRLGRMTHLQASVGYFLDTGLGKWHNTLGTVLDPQPSDKFSGVRVTLALSFGPGREMAGSEMAD